VWVQIADLSLYNNQHMRTSPINSEHTTRSVGRHIIAHKAAIRHFEFAKFHTLICDSSWN